MEGSRRHTEIIPVSSVYASHLDVDIDLFLPVVVNNGPILDDEPVLRALQVYRNFLHRGHHLVCLLRVQICL